MAYMEGTGVASLSSVRERRLAAWIHEIMVTFIGLIEGLYKVHLGVMQGLGFTVSQN